VPDFGERFGVFSIQLGLLMGQRKLGTPLSTFPTVVCTSQQVLVRPESF
jgi:hypothetical protein